MTKGLLYSKDTALTGEPGRQGQEEQAQNELRIISLMQKRRNATTVCFASLTSCWQEVIGGTPTVFVQMPKGDGDLFELIQRHHGTEEWNEMLPDMMIQLIRELMKLHDMNIAHRDLKPENVVFMKKSGGVELHLIDYGYAVDILEGDKHLCRCRGTAHYAAPELYNTPTSEELAHVALDIWSLGVVLFILVAGMFPFGQSPGMCNEYAGYVRGPLSREEWILASLKRHKPRLEEDVLVKLVHVIVHMLDPDPRRRHVPVDAESTISAAFSTQQSKRSHELCSIY